MKIYFNGDDHVAGTELNDPKTESIAAHLSALFDAEYVNDAVPYSSVNQIIRRTTDFISNCKHTNSWPDLMVIGLANWDREDWFYNGQHQNNSITSNEHPERYQYWKQHISKDEPHIGHLTKHYNNVLYNLHSELFCLGVPHLFFNCAMPLRCAKEMITFDWAGFYLKPYQLTFNYRNWCRYKGYLEITPGNYHYNSEANQEWAKLLYDHIQQFNLLTKDEHGSLYNLGRQRRRHYGPGVGEWDEELLRPPSV